MSFCPGRTLVSTRLYDVYCLAINRSCSGASGIALLSVIASIFAGRYVDLTRTALWLSWVVLGTTVAAEVAGKFVLNMGLATQIRPRQYYTVSREALDGVLGDVHELINFFIIETQRIVFVENVAVSLAVSFLH